MASHLLEAALAATTALAALTTAESARADDLGDLPLQPVVAAPPAPYVLPFGLRSIVPATALRAETALGLASGTSRTLVQYLTASYTIVPKLSAFVRGGWTGLFPEASTASNAFTNVAVGGTWAPRTRGSLRAAMAFGTGLPVGQGGGPDPNAGEAAAISAGNLARSRFEGSTMFLPNDVAPFVGLDLAWVAGGFTAQAEANLFEAIRVRGAESEPDSHRTAFTTGVHVGYLFWPAFSLSAELRDQTFLSTPKAVEEGKTSRSWVTVAAGPRAHLRLGGHAWLRPGLAYVQPLNDPSPAQRWARYHIVQLDIPISF